MRESKNNILIAEFMGFQKTNSGWYDYEDLLTIVYANTGSNTHDNLHFEEDWNWLMPVVNKIRSLYNNTEVTDEKGSDIINDLAEGCIEANILQVHKAVIDFINWYNNQKEEGKQ